MSVRVFRATPGAALLAIAMCAGCSKTDAPSVSAAPPIPVAVALAESSDAPIIIRAIGSVESKARVMLRPQVEGRVADLSAKEGTDVEAGTILLRLDSRPFSAALRQAEADLNRARAIASNARYIAERNRSAAASGAASERELQDAESIAAASEAEVLASEARIDTARLNQSYCEIAAPFAGRLGQFLVKPGSIVKANEADLVELAQTDPIEVAFAVAEENIPQVRDAIARSGALRVEALPRGETAAASVGSLTFVDNKVDTSTGTIRLKATFENANRRLWPGQFTNVSLILGDEPNSVMIPDRAVQPSQSGPSVFIVKPDHTAELRLVSVRRNIDGKSIIDRGVSVGETVVTDGQLRLAPGSSVQIKTDAKAPAAS